MPLIECPGCGRYISDTAPACIICGRPAGDRGEVSAGGTSGSAGRTRSYADLPFHPISPTKLATLSFVTFGLYEIVWFYRNWKKMKDRGADLMPIMRSIFAPLFSHALFNAVQEEAGRRRVGHTWHPGVMAVAFLALTASWRLPDPYWLVSLFTFVPLIPVQKTINDLLGADGRRQMDSSYAPGTVILIIVGGLLALLALLGTFFPE